MRSFLLSLALSAASLVPVAQAAAPNANWESWYTISVRKTPYAYYSEKHELRSGKHYFLNQVWKKEADFINEEQVGVVTAADAELSAQFFNFHSNYRASETTVDGAVKDSIVTIRVKQGGKDLPQIRKPMPKKAFFSTFFPVWLSQQLPSMKEGRSLSYLTIFEDNLEAGFSAVVGQVQLEKPDDYAKKNHAHKLSVTNGNLRSTWWVDDNGSSLRIENPSQGTVVERVARAKAEAFLK
jgi:hypothetical protein